jgi:hypothetical protein
MFMRCGALGRCTHKSAFCQRGSANVRFAPRATKVLRLPRRMCHEPTFHGTNVTEHPALTNLDQSGLATENLTKMAVRTLVCASSSHTLNISAGSFLFSGCFACEVSRWQSSFQYSCGFAQLRSVVSNFAKKPSCLIARDAIGPHQISYLNSLS